MLSDLVMSWCRVACLGALLLYFLLVSQLWYIGGNIQLKAWSPSREVSQPYRRSQPYRWTWQIILFSSNVLFLWRVKWPELLERAGGRVGNALAWGVAVVYKQRWPLDQAGRMPVGLPSCIGESRKCCVPPRAQASHRAAPGTLQLVMLYSVLAAHADRPALCAELYRDWRAGLPPADVIINVYSQYEELMLFSTYVSFFCHFISSSGCRLFERSHL